MKPSRKSTGILLGICLALLALVVACGEEATPTPSPTATPGPTPDVASAIQQAVQQALAAMPTPAPGVSAEDIPSIEDISSLVQAAVQASVPEGTSPEQIQQMVQAAVQAAAQPGITREDLQRVVQSAVDQAVQQAVSQITPVVTTIPVATATPIATTTPTSVATTGPTGTLDVGVVDLDPFVGGPPSEQGFLMSLFESLFTHENLFILSPEGKIVPLLATEFTIDPTGLVYTFKLREGVKWNDAKGRDFGTFNADDLLWTTEDLSKEGAIQSNAGDWRELFACDGCQLIKINDHEVQLERPSPTFEIPFVSTVYIVGNPMMHSKRHFDAVGLEQAREESVGTGPWQLVETKADAFFRVEAVRDHWRKTPEWDELVWQVISEESTRLANFLTGQIDTGQFSLESVDAIKRENQPEVKFLNASAGTVQVLNLHGMQYYPDHPNHAGEDANAHLGEDAAYTEACKVVPYTSCDRDTSSDEWERAKKVRLAMNLAIDRQKLVNNLAFGEGTPWFVSRFLGHETRMKEFGLDKLAYEFNPQRAKDLLAEAGIPGGFELDMFLTPTGLIQAGQAVATMWEDVGIRANQKNTPYGPFRPQTVNRTARGVSTHSVGPAVEPLLHWSLFYSAQSSFNFGFEHPDFEAFLERARQTLDPDERFAIQAEAARWIFDNAMLLPLYSQAIVWPLGPELDPWEIAPLGASRASYWEFAPHRR